MTERSLFNVACKLLGLWWLSQGVGGLIWAFLASRFASPELPFDPPESTSWMAGALYAMLGLFFCARSSWVTRVFFALDRELDSRGEQGG
jgi:hypothetical protein